MRSPLRRRPEGLAGRVVAVTGGARGIGAAAARRLAAAGASVAVGDLDADDARQVADELPGAAAGLELDVTDEASYRAFLDAVDAELGPLEVLVANAGVMWVGPFAEEPEAAVGRQLAVNVDGVIRGFRLAAPAMRTRGRGQVLVVASAASRLAPKGEATYSATKHAVLGYCTAVREELRGTGVDVSVLMPTLVSTDLAAGTTSGKVPALSPGDVADAVVDLVGRPRPETFLPARVGLAAAALTVAPGPLQGPLHRFFVPDQLDGPGRHVPGGLPEPPPSAAGRAGPLADAAPRATVTTAPARSERRAVGAAQDRVAQGRGPRVLHGVEAQPVHDVAEAEPPLGVREADRAAQPGRPERRRGSQLEPGPRLAPAQRERRVPLQHQVPGPATGRARPARPRPRGSRRPGRAVARRWRARPYTAASARAVA